MFFNGGMLINSLIPKSTERVQLHTNFKINEKIEKQSIENIKRYYNANFEMLSKRIVELNKEWDTERVLETNASTLSFISIILGFASNNPIWFILAAVVGLFLLQHAILGWCPPLPIIRKLGIRTPEEISNEKMIIKFFRGDFKQEKIDFENVFKAIKND